MQKKLNWQRLIVGIISLLLLAIGCVVYFSDPQQAGGATGIMIRIGVVLGVIWLAMPQLTSLQTRISTAVLMVVLILLIVAASRPNLFRVVAGIIAIGLAVNWILKWTSKYVGR